MRIDRRTALQGPEFTLVGRLEDGAVRRLQRVLSGPASAGEVVTLDLSELEACDADGAALLATITKRARAAGGELLLAAAPPDVLRAFDDASVTDLLCIVRAPADGDLFVLGATRYLFRGDDDRPFAYACNRRDFRLLSDNTIWAHESHNWLLAPGTGAPIAHRTRGASYCTETGERLQLEWTSRRTVDS